MPLSLAFARNITDSRAQQERKMMFAEIQRDKVKKGSKIQFMQMEASSGAAAGVQQKPPSESVKEPSAPALPEEVPEVVIPHWTRRWSCHPPTMTSFWVRSCSSLLCLLHRHIVLTRGTGQETSRSASAPHQGGQQTVVVSGATTSQAPRAGSSTSPQRIVASRHYVQRVPGRLHFWRKKLPLSS